jgi:hypothetical protein
VDPAAFGAAGGKPSDDDAPSKAERILISEVNIRGVQVTHSAPPGWKKKVANRDVWDSGGRSLTRPFRHARRFPSTRR